MTKIINGEYHLPMEMAAQICDVTKQTMMLWRKQPHPPPYSDVERLYPAIGLGKWIRNRQLMKKPGRRPDNPMPSLPGVTIPDHMNHKDRLTSLQADKVEMELKKEAGLLIPAEDVTSAIVNMNTRVKTRLLGVGPIVSPQVVGEKDVHVIRKIIDDQIREILDELSADWQNEDDDNDDG